MARGQPGVPRASRQKETLFVFNAFPSFSNTMAKSDVIMVKGFIHSVKGNLKDNLLWDGGQFRGPLM